MKILPSATTWRNLDIMLSKVSEKQKDIYCICANLCVESKKVKLIETKNGEMAVRGQEWRKWENIGQGV